MCLHIGKGGGSSPNMWIHSGSKKYNLIKMKNEFVFSVCLPEVWLDKIFEFRKEVTRVRLVFLIKEIMRKSQQLSGRGVFNEVQLPSQILKNLLGSRYRQILNKLESDILKINENYLKGVRSKSYRLSYNHSLDFPKLYSFTTGDLAISEFNSRMFKMDCPDTGYLLGMTGIDGNGARLKSREYIESKEFLNNNKIELDCMPGRGEKILRLDSEGLITDHSRNSRDHMTLEFDSDKLIFIRDDKTVFYCRKEDYELYKTYNISLGYSQMICDWENRCFYSSRDKTVHRLYSNFVNFPNILMPYLTFYGEPLGYIDFSNFQPLLLGLSLAGQVENGISKYFRGLSIESSTYKYVELCSEGKLYSHMAGLLGYKHPSIAKQNNWRCLFDSRVESDKDDVYKDCMRSDFPQVVECIDKYKLAFRYKGPKWYGELSRELTRTEAKFMVDTLFSKLRALGIPCLTRHDAIYFPLSRSKEVEEVVKQIADEYLGTYHLKLFNTLNG
jgi:hypothetical protein